MHYIGLPRYCSVWYKLSGRLGHLNIQCVYTTCVRFFIVLYCGLDESKGVLWLKCTKLRWIQMIRGVGPYELTLDGWSNVVLWLNCITLRWVQMIIGGVGPAVTSRPQSVSGALKEIPTTVCLPHTLLPTPQMCFDM